MDIGQFAFPFIMAVITNSIMIVAIYFLRKIPYFANLFSVWFMVVLYLVCVLRVFLPLEFPNVQIIIRDNVVLNSMVNALMIRTSETMGEPSAFLYIIFAVWIIGIIVFAVVSFYTHHNRKIYYLANYDFTTDQEKCVFNQVKKEILGDHSNVVLKKTDGVKSIMVIGYFQKYVLLPEKDYSVDELEMIFRHECTHVKNKDLWLKLLVHIYCCIFWWNPFSYLLKHDLDFTLEMRCDLSATGAFTDAQKAKYFEALTSNCRTKTKGSKDDRNHFFICSELSGSRKNKEFIKRTKSIAKEQPNRIGQIVANSAVSLVLMAVFVVSYFFIIQPSFGLPAEETDYKNGAVIADDSNCYLVKQEDGSYLFYFLDYPPMLISAEEFDEEMYEGYPILEN